MLEMSERARKLLHDAMDLPVSERAELAADLLASLDGEPEADVEAAWTSEIERRAREALADPDDDVAWERYAPSCMQLRRDEQAGPACP
jgi:putative addiction module component (TIGR02574 family)